MSGFAGAISLDGAPPDTQLLKRMSDQLAFRGPDATNVVVQSGAGFVFTFLRTGPAPQCPSQPCTLDGRVWLIGDIRLDGRNDLRLKLEQHGDRFDTDPTDEELVLRAWQCWGESALPDLIGDYCLAVWDSKARRLTCARDLIGARPFFYAQADGWLYFSNTLNAIRSSAAISADLDPHFIGDFLLDGWCHDLERTAFRDVKRLQAGCALHFSPLQVRARRFTSIPIDQPLRLKTSRDYVEQFRVLLDQAVLDRLPRGKAAVFMSGGLDSTGIAALAVNCARKNKLPSQLRAYTLDYRPLLDDEEGILASRAAEFIGIPITIQCGAFCLPFAGWADSLPLPPEPCHEPFRELSVTQTSEAAKHARVAFNGYGGDGVLTGQTWPYFVDRIRKSRLDEVVSTLGGYFLRRGRIPPLRGGFRGRLRRWIRPTDPLANYPRWLAPQFEQEMRLRDRWRDLQRPPASSHPWYPKAYSILENFSTIVESEEPPVSGIPIEPRAPLLDLRVQKFMLRTPPIPLCIDKELLRRALQGLLPREILMRPKTGFQGDQVALNSSRNSWGPLPLPPATDSIQKFVDWQKLSEILANRAIVYPWPDLRPVSLVYWLRGIERVHRIQLQSDR